MDIVQILQVIWSWIKEHPRLFISGLVTLIIAFVTLYFTILPNYSDFDNDGIPDHIDSCGTQPGVVENNGCPDSINRATEISDDVQVTEVNSTDSPAPTEISITLMPVADKNILEILQAAIPSLQGENSTLQEIATAHAQCLSTKGNSSVDDIAELITFQSGDNLRGELRRAGYNGFDTAELLVFIGDEVTAELITMIAQSQDIDLQAGFVSYGYASIHSRLNQRDNTVLILGKTP